MSIRLCPKQTSYSIERYARARDRVSGQVLSAAWV